MLKLLDRILKVNCFLMLPALLYSKALITICYGVFLVVALILHFSAKKSALAAIKTPQYGLFVLAFVSVLTSGFYSQNVDEWLHHLVIRLPIVILPLSFYYFDIIDRRFVDWLQVGLITILCLSSIPVLIEYASDYSTYNHIIGMGQYIPTPVEHVKYSMMNAYGVMVAIGLCLYRRQYFSKGFIAFLIVGGVYLTLYMHILAVRTGLVILYLSVFVLLCIRLSQRNELRWSILSLLILCFFAVLTPRLIPSLHTKIGYMYHDWQMYREGTGALYNDSDRIESLAIGWKLIQRNPIVGVGMGDLRKECVVEYKKTGRTDSYKLPHSQLVYVWAGCGIIGLILFLSGFYGPLWAVGWRSSYFLGFLYLNYSLSFLVENSLERSFSLAFFLFFALLNIRIGHKKSTI